jgi:hypothetical protein
MIVTADCDIAQDKAGEELTLLQIVTAEHYIRETWAKREGDRLYKRQLDAALPPLNGAIAKHDPSLSLLTGDLLSDWVKSSGVAQILSALSLTGKAASEVSRHLECISAWLDDEPMSPLSRLDRMWKATGTAPKAIKGRLSDVLDPARGPADAYFLPYIPDLTELGFIIKLRSFESIPKKMICSSRTDSKISGNPKSYYRIARLSDGIKYSVVQKMAILFSRIGLEEDFESESSVASDLIVESIHSEICGEQK